MATGTLQVTPQELTTTATEFQGKAGEVKGLTGDMTETVRGLSGQVWSGEAAQAYVNKFNGLQDDMNYIYNMIKEHADDLIQMAREYSEAETESQDLIDELVSDVIV